MVNSCRPNWVVDKDPAARLRCPLLKDVPGQVLVFIANRPDMPVYALLDRIDHTHNLHHPSAHTRPPVKLTEKMHSLGPCWRRWLGIDSIEEKVTR